MQPITAYRVHILFMRARRSRSLADDDIAPLPLPLAFLSRDVTIKRSSVVSYFDA